MAEPKLLPCPFPLAHVVEYGVLIGLRKDGWVVRCRDCRLQVKGESKDDAIAIWNTRDPSYGLHVVKEREVETEVDDHMRFMRWWKSQGLSGESERCRLIAQVAFKAGLIEKEVNGNEAKV